MSNDKPTRYRVKRIVNGNYIWNVAIIPAGKIQVKDRVLIKQYHDVIMSETDLTWDIYNVRHVSTITSATQVGRSTATLAYRTRGLIGWLFFSFIHSYDNHKGLCVLQDSGVEYVER